ncbi:MAG: HNH endonuclease [Caldilineaceae bacterium]
MRPIERGDSPIAGDFANYRDAFAELVSRLGSYCSYCERRIPTQLAVEHIQPKAEGLYPHLVGRWDNYLLGCVNCNSTKGDKDVQLDRVLLPDRDNTSAALIYAADGTVEIHPEISQICRPMAELALSIPGLDKPISEVFDANGRLVAIDRVGQRMEIWAIAEVSKEDLATLPSDVMRRQIVKTALASGCFSIWITVFADDPVMRRLLIDGFPGTAQSCFDADTTVLRSPRESNGLAHAGKV